MLKKSKRQSNLGSGRTKKSNRLRARERSTTAAHRERRNRQERTKHAKANMQKVQDKVIEAKTGIKLEPDKNPSIFDMFGNLCK